MTNQELFDLTHGHESRPWWPTDLALACYPPRLYIHGKELNPDAAERLLLGSALIWLKENYRFARIGIGKNESVVSVDLMHDRIIGGPQLLATILATCEAVYKAGGGE